MQGTLKKFQSKVTLKFVSTAIQFWVIIVYFLLIKIFKLKDTFFEILFYFSNALFCSGSPQVATVTHVQIINLKSNFYFGQGLSKLLICGGYAIDTCEVIDLKSSATICKNLPNFPATVQAAIGGLGLKENPIMCGGYQNQYSSNKCHSLENNEWVSSDSMNLVRVEATAAQLQDGKLLVTGGKNGSHYISSAEMLTDVGWESNIPSLPVTINGHCMVTVNSTTVMVIGGIQNSQSSGKTFYFTFGEECWTEGPKLKYRRGHHSCGRIRSGKESQKMSIIVAGGSSFLSSVDIVKILADVAGGSIDELSFLSSVEILDEGSNKWQAGPELPFEIRFSQMVEDQNGGVVLVGGQSPSVSKLENLYKLPHAGRDAVWTKMQQKLKTGRKEHTAFLVPDNIVECSPLHKNSISGKKQKFV